MDIVLGEILVQPYKVHGAINTIIVLDEDPSGWEMKQFITEEQLNRYAAENHLIIKYQGEQT